MIFSLTPVVFRSMLFNTNYVNFPRLLSIGDL